MDQRFNVSIPDSMIADLKMLGNPSLSAMLQDAIREKSRQHRFFARFNSFYPWNCNWPESFAAQSRYDLECKAILWALAA